MTQRAVPVRDPSQVGEARRLALRLAEDAGLTDAECAAVGLVATELATNLAVHAVDGELLPQPWRDAAGTSLEIVAIDRGPGVGDFERCFADGFSTRGTAGTGLGAVRRAARECDAFSRPGSGTVVFTRVGGSPTTGDRARFEWGAVCVAMPGESACGDAWRVHASGEDVALLVADGVGHGPAAAAVAQQACRTFEVAPDARPDDVLRRAHEALAGTRGAAVFVAAVSRGTLAYAGIGNVAGTLLAGGAHQGLVSLHGMVGTQGRRVRQFERPWPERGLLIVHTDGLQSRWSQADVSAVLGRHPAVVAALMYRDFRRGRDDVGMLAVRGNP